MFLFASGASAKKCDPYVVRVQSTRTYIKPHGNSKIERSNSLKSYEAAVRFFTRSFLKMLCKWIFTVPSDRFKCCAISFVTQTNRCETGDFPVRARL